MSSEEGGGSGGFKIPFVSDILKEGEKLKIPFVSDMLKEGEQLKIPFISDRGNAPPAGEEGHRECCCNGCFGCCDKVKEWWEIFVEKIKEFFSCLGSCSSTLSRQLEFVCSSVIQSCYYAFYFILLVIENVFLFSLFFRK
ncbi:hypothetical protein MKX01_040087 [Papaver californicum]|nr:hypothetical protein MKX01_040087 [Papaver californicum]